MNNSISAVFYGVDVDLDLDSSDNDEENIEDS